MRIPYLPLGDIATEMRSGFACGEEDPQGVAQLRMNNVTREGSLDWTKIRRVPTTKGRNEFCLADGDILFNATNSPELVGKTAMFIGIGEPVTFSNHFVRIRVDRKRAAPSFVARWLQSQFSARIFEGMCRQWVNQASVTKDQLANVSIPLPPLDEQHRIAAILDQTDDLRRRRRETLEALDSLAQATFFDFFGDPVSNAKKWNEDLRLGDVTDLVSGITKGRKLNGCPTREVPYLAVANVQDKALNLKAVKTIEATAEEISRYRLMKDDLLLTEGGDPDKLGRGTLWNNEIDECIHQNHIFRVRLHSDRIHPVFLNWLVGSRRGKSYFLKSAKQTTGIASINMTQLRGFPLLAPPYSLQAKFAEWIAQIDKLKSGHTAHLETLEVLFASLQHRAFRGEL